MYRYVRKYPFSVLLTVVIWVLCLIPIVKNPIPSMQLTDKWAHCLMYFVFTLCIWVEYLWSHHQYNYTKLLCFGCIAPVVMGGLVEIAQATCTGGHRSGEWLDFVADTIGVLIACCISCLLATGLSKYRKAR